MNVERLALPDVLLVRPRIFRDPRGYFLETHHQERYRDAGIAGPFVQDNVSRSARGVVRGLHFQEPNPQGKLVTVLSGAIFDVAVDIRKSSPTFGRWVGATLAAETHEQLWVPTGFAHGFCALTDDTLVVYKCTAPYDPSAERTLLFSDADIGVSWPLTETRVSEKDARGSLLRDFPRDWLPA